MATSRANGGLETNREKADPNKKLPKIMNKGWWFLIDGIDWLVLAREERITARSLQTKENNDWTRKQGANPCWKCLGQNPLLQLPVESARKKRLFRVGFNSPSRLTWTFFFAFWGRTGEKDHNWGSPLRWSPVAQVLGLGGRTGTPRNKSWTKAARPFYVSSFKDKEA